MTTESRNLTQIQGANVTVPTQNGYSATGWAVFANDAAYEAVYGAGQQGDCYFNSSELVLRQYNGTEWVYLQNGINALEDSASTGSSQDLDSTYHNLLKLTNASLTSVRSLDPGQTLVVYLVNDTGSDITLLHEDGTATAANRLLLPAGVNFTLEDGSTAHFVYDSLASRFRYTNAAGSGGSGTGTGSKNYVLTPDSSTSVTDVGGSVSTDTTTLADLPEETKGVGVLVTQTAGSIGNTSTWETNAIDDGDGGRIGSCEMYWKTKSGYVDDAASIQWYNSDTATVLRSFDIKAGSGRISNYQDSTVVLTTDENIKPRIYWNVTSETNGLVVSGAGTLAETALVGSTITDWQAYTPTNTQGFGTITSRLQWRQNGQNIDIKGDFDAGTTAASEAQIELPNNYTISLKSSTGTTLCGSLYRDNLNTSAIIYNALATDGDTFLNFSAKAQGSSRNGLVGENGNTVMTTGERASIDISVPVAELNGSVMLGTEAQAQNARARFYLGSNTAYTLNTRFPFDTESTLLENKGGFVNNSAGTLSVDAAGTYEITSAIRDNAGTLSGTAIRLYKNTVLTVTMDVNSGAVVSGNTTIDLVPSDVFSIRLNSSFTAVGADSDSWVQIVRVADRSSKAPGFPTSNLASADAEYLVPRYQTQTVAADNDFSSGNITCTRIGNFVQITSDTGLGHASLNTVNSSSGLIPADFRPLTTSQFNTSYHDATSAVGVEVNTAGRLQLFFRDDSGSVARTSTGIPVNISYLIV